MWPRRGKILSSTYYTWPIPNGLTLARTQRPTTIMPPPWETWRQDINDKLDRWGEEKLHLRQSHSKPLYKKDATYEERLARMRSGGGAEGAIQGQTYHRTVPPLPPQPTDIGNNFATERSSVPTPQAPPTAAAPLHLQFSRFTETDKQAFFALLDEYFVKRSSGGDMWYVC